jgi:hypothetical protein
MQQNPGRRMDFGKALKGIRVKLKQKIPGTNGAMLNPEFYFRSG